MAYQDIAVVGAGALGSYYGARLALHGHRVHLLLRSDYDTVRERGLLIKSKDGDFSLRPDQISVYNDATRMPKCDLVLVTLKTVANDTIDRLVSPLLKDDSTILTLQNGLGSEQQLAGLFGAERVVGGLAFVCIHRERAGEIHHTDHGLIKIGEFAKEGISERIQVIAAMCNAAKIRCDMLENLAYGRWEKLVWNVPFNGLGAALNLATDGLLASSDGRQLVEDVMNEVVAAAASVGVDLRPGTVRFQIDRTASMGAYRTSMQIDRIAGRPMEVEAIIGEPLRVGQRNGVVMPLIESLYRFLKTLDGAISRTANPR